LFDALPACRLQFSRHPARTACHSVAFSRWEQTEAAPSPSRRREAGSKGGEYVPTPGDASQATPGRSGATGSDWGTTLVKRPQSLESWQYPREAVRPLGSRWRGVWGSGLSPGGTTNAPPLCTHLDGDYIPTDACNILPDLAEDVTAWPELPEALHIGIE